MAARRGSLQGRTIMLSTKAAPATIAERKSALLFGRLAEPILRYVVYAIIAIVFLMPFVWMFTGSVRREAEIHGLMFPFNWHTIVPIQWTVQSYLDIFGISEEGAKGGLRFQRGLMNSGIIAVAVVASSMLFNTMAAF